ncbi:SAVED domain-containing protein [Alkalihalobacillus hwajinpoensis]|uniref:SAVED domain-containing protein n=1 Tax=Guptibacillus hwajinpoensis TaxID=208199 RepID=UPI001883BD72|nr:SAVED domain-containing protein [Pseudalkalibacillus hwajinpoensis]MBF0705796.1 SAVED domain-containing protein [Pseudalkalibacillus hwajinpoensis]
MKIIRSVEGLFNLIQSDPVTAILMLLILIFSSIILYKKWGWLQIVYNWVINHILRFMKRDFILLATFTKKEANFNSVKREYQEQGCLYITQNFLKKTNNDGSINYKDLQQILDKQRSKMKISIKRSKNSNSLIYLGFPHVPIAFLDGYHFKSTDEAILYEYQGEDSECLGKGFYELKRKYNTDMKIINDYDINTNYEKEVALKIEQSFSIMNEEIKTASGVEQVISLGLETPSRWSVTNYAQIDLYEKRFIELLSKLKKSGVNRIHLFAATPVSLSFSLGRMVEHYHPEVIVYNYNNNSYDWAINLRTEKILTLKDE